jgi:hypothetical protein
VLLPSLIAALYLTASAAGLPMPTHTPARGRRGPRPGAADAVLIAPQTSCSAAPEPEAIPYVDAVGATLLGRPPTAADTLAGNGSPPSSPGIRPPSAGCRLQPLPRRDVVTNPTQLLSLCNNNTSI